MRTCNTSPLLMLKLIYFTLRVLEAQQLNVKPKATGYLGHDVILPCQFIQGPENAVVTQVQWDLLEPEGKRVTIIFSNSYFGVNIPDSPLKGRVEIKEQSLIIKDVKMADAGSYTCSVTTFPSGSFDGTTKLVVKEKTVQMHTLPRLIAAGVFVLIVVTMAVTTYIIIIRMRRGSSVRHRTTSGTGGPVMCN
ncbi:nectin-3-like protein isoform X1 [Lates japonicus]|uniref:Nectin-3-like protein isoform X1 n=1 Tax=Lates japonicus TaxID=270547 RepID=A0AAD3REV9_LATJO|nr:nectin-3-like protein isoform X1 [Lates japonicus]